MDPADPYHWMAIQGVVVKIIDEDDPVHGTMATESINEMSQSYLGKSTSPCATRPVAKYGHCVVCGQTERGCLGTPKGIMRPNAT
jgi:hypothetical protein